MANLYLSICIPTNGRIEILKNTLDSIFSDCTVSYSDFEVVLSDNSKNEELEILMKSYEQFPNIVYSKTDCEGFLNSINALKLGKGLFLKLHNNYTMFSSQGLSKLISFIKQNEPIRPLVFFKNSGKEELKKYDSFNSFNLDLSFWNTWSSGFSIWKEDFINMSDLEVNKMFPHTSLLLNQYSKDLFIINDYVFFENQEVPQKGGYNLFRTFAVDYLQMMEQTKEKGHISSLTFEKIKDDLFFNFLIIWYYNTKINKNEFTFNLENIKGSLQVYYGKNSYFKLLFLSYLLALKKKTHAFLVLIKSSKST
ncbi:glycosyltransferase [Flavobacterium sp. KACC 22761]|uniref:glycosyltransferase n=1 Tax=Flavobacterium sp. KACC 22761 TaxID=3092665 RepID=UPI002A752736|nr:glycosyltransferase [Flavobacterium sp. KACC 22761]WPO79527.1 hypothetical protein SCB73_03900 [Flavobacterium sp. KACC 22761]